MQQKFTQKKVNGIGIIEFLSLIVVVSYCLRYPTSQGRQGSLEDEHHDDNQTYRLPPV